MIPEQRVLGFVHNRRRIVVCPVGKTVTRQSIVSCRVYFSKKSIQDSMKLTFRYEQRGQMHITTFGVTVFDLLYNRCEPLRCSLYSLGSSIPGRKRLFVRSLLVLSTTERSESTDFSRSEHNLSYEKEKKKMLIATFSFEEQSSMIT